MVSLGDQVQITRDDILDFSKGTIKLILELQKDKGWRAFRSSKNHVMLLAPDGVTRLGASRNNDATGYLQRAVRKYYEDKGEVEEAEKVVAAEKFACPRPKCPKFFNTLDNLTIHINVDHEGKVKCPDCIETFEKPHVLGIHRAKAHGYVSPTRARRLELKAEREALLESLREQAKVEDALKYGVDSAHEAGRKMGEDMKSLDIIPESHRDGHHHIGTTKELVEHFKEDIDKILEEKGIVPTVQQLDSEEVFEVQHIEDDEEREKRIDRIVKHWEQAKATRPVDEPLSPEYNRDSWVLDMSMIMDVPVETVLKNMMAAGLNMEIRVWKES